jgi:acetyl esterase/lipase
MPRLPGDLSAAADIKRDVTYCTASGIALKLDIYVPKTSGDKLLPVAAYVHGGGWTSGDKGSGEGMLDAAELLRRGYLVASLNYRLAPQFKFPAQIEDVKCAIRYLRASASTFHLDPNRIGVWGSSAGGHLVSLLGTAGPAAGFEGSGGYADQASSVRAVVDMFGPADLAKEFAGVSERIGRSVFGATSNQDLLLMRASPVSYVSADDPPFLILQGDRDRLVPPSQSQELFDRLKAAGVNVTLVIVKNSGHGFLPEGGPISPSRSQISSMVADFFDKYLK